MKIITFLTLVFLSTTMVFAQQDRKAKEILDNSSASFSKAGGIKASFLFTLENTKSKTKEVIHGSISMKGNKYMLEAPNYLVWFDGTSQWLYIKGNSEVTLTKPDKEEAQMINPAVLMSVYKRGFDYSYKGEKSYEGKNVYEIQLIPQKKGDWKNVTLYIDKTSNLPVYIYLQYSNGINNIVKISKYQTNQSFVDSFFKFDKSKYPNVDVIDLR
ncbi:MAG: outer-membrane lipoprotein carrier protein LolA [Candidatus Azobacteroides sp.]|nr:outer-membrane lipoprotein carrier protein LolA [Candidatus Azobacteroides sp.]